MFFAKRHSSGGDHVGPRSDKHVPGSGRDSCVACGVLSIGATPHLLDKQRESSELTWILLSRNGTTSSLNILYSRFV